MVTFTSLDIKFTLGSKLLIKNWVKFIALTEEQVLGDIAYVFCSDAHLLSMNEQYLKHDTYTDIITFDYCENNRLSGDIFISIDRVKENASAYNISFNMELGRVMAHGVLHLAGYKDKKEDDKKEMRMKEDFYLSSFPLS